VAKNVPAQQIQSIGLLVLGIVVITVLVGVAIYAV
jgi:hypothetical protein